MQLFLTGATGFLGRHLLPRLSAAGHDCLAYTRYLPDCKDLRLVPRVTLRQADIFDPDRLDEGMQGADAVINMVGILNERGRKGEGFQRAHVELVEQLLDACRRNGVRRFIHVSALGAGQGSSHYLISKGEAEERIRAADWVDATILQPSVIFGRGDAFFNRFAGLLRAAPFIPLACPDAKMQPVWAGDVCEAIARSLDDADTIGQTLTAVGPEVFTLRELVAFTAATADLKARIFGLPDSLARLQAKIMDFVPGKPFSTDNYRSLQTPNTSRVNGLAGLGIKPSSVHMKVPAYLAKSGRQRRLDQFRRRTDG